MLGRFVATKSLVVECRKKHAIGRLEESRSDIGSGLDGLLVLTDKIGGMGRREMDGSVGGTKEFLHLFVSKNFGTIGVHHIIALVDEKRTRRRSEKDAMKAVLGDAEDEIAAKRSRMQIVVAEQADVIAVVATQTIDSAIPQVALSILHDAVDTEHRQFGYLRNGLQGRHAGGLRLCRTKRSQTNRKKQKSLIAGPHSSVFSFFSSSF